MDISHPIRIPSHYAQLQIIYILKLVCKSFKHKIEIRKNEPVSWNWLRGSSSFEGLIIRVVVTLEESSTSRPFMLFPSDIGTGQCMSFI